MIKVSSVLLLVGSAALSSLSTAAPTARTIAACPGQSLTLSFLVGKLNASTRVCMKMVNTLDGKPTSVDFWKIGTFGQIDKLGTKDGAACFDYSISVVGRQELRAGGFKNGTTIYMIEVDTTRQLRSPFEEHDYLLATLKVPPEATYKKGAIDPCRPLCEQIPPPAMSQLDTQDRCKNFCAPDGNWRVSCPDPEAYDRKTGKRIIPR